LQEHTEGDLKLKEYYDILAYQNLIVSDSASNYSLFVKYKKLYYKGMVSTERTEVYKALMEYYNIVSMQEEILEDLSDAFQAITRARDKVLYYMQKEREAALIKAGYGSDEIAILEAWVKQPIFNS
jgi:hypothetical protein